MKVALLSPCEYPIAEPFAGGTEAFIFRLAACLLRWGVKVACYACEGSDIPGVEMRICGPARERPLSSEPPAPQSRQIMASAFSNAALKAALDDASHDSSIAILHNNSFSSLPFYTQVPMPVVHTLHLPPIKPDMVVAIRRCYKNGHPLHLVATSQAQARAWQTHHPVSHVIYPRLDMQSLPSCNLTHQGRLAFVGRIHPQKGLEDAIAVAVALGKGLDIYGGVQGPQMPYFQKRIQPLLQQHSNVVYHGLIPQAELLWQLRQAQALLFPIKWDEPCGYVVMEAMALGVPAIMYERGAARELIIEGINGFIVAPDQPEAMAAAVERTALVDRARCAAEAREKFDIAISVEQYLELFNALMTARVM